MPWTGIGLASLALAFMLGDLAWIGPKRRAIEAAFDVRSFALLPMEKGGQAALIADFARWNERRGTPVLNLFQQVPPADASIQPVLCMLETEVWNPADDGEFHEAEAGVKTRASIEYPFRALSARASWGPLELLELSANTSRVLVRLRVLESPFHDHGGLMGISVHGEHDDDLRESDSISRDLGAALKLASMLSALAAAISVLVQRIRSR